MAETFFRYNGRPKDMPIGKYLMVYDAFCKAYDIRPDDIDRRSFETEIEKRIMKRAKPEGVSYRPVFGGNKGRAMLIISPRPGYVIFHAHSYFGKDEFTRFRDLSSKIFEKPNLEDIIK